MSRKRFMTLVICAIIVLVLGVALILHLSYFSEDTPEVILPDVQGNVNDSENDKNNDSSNTEVISINPVTVKTVIEETIERADNYYRTVSVELVSGDDSLTTKFEIWEMDGYTKTSVAREGKTTKFYAMDESNVYIWNEGDESCETLPKGDFTTDDIQMLYTYEDVKDSENITSAQYVELDGVRCIFFECTEEEYIGRFWVSMEDGLLVRAELEENDALTYVMRAGESTVDSVTAENFILPDGTRLAG